MIAPESLFLTPVRKEHSCLKICYIQHIPDIFLEELSVPFEQLLSIAGICQFSRWGKDNWWELIISTERLHWPDVKKTACWFISYGNQQDLHFFFMKIIEGHRRIQIAVTSFSFLWIVLGNWVDGMATSSMINFI